MVNNSLRSSNPAGIVIVPPGHVAPDTREMIPKINKIKIDQNLVEKVWLTFHDFVPLYKKQLTILGYKVRIKKFIFTNSD